MEFSKEEEEEELEVEDWQGRALKSPSPRPPSSRALSRGLGGGLQSCSLFLSAMARRIVEQRPSVAAALLAHRLRRSSRSNARLNAIIFDQRFSKEEKGNRMINSDDWLDGGRNLFGVI